MDAVIVPLESKTVLGLAIFFYMLTNIVYLLALLQWRKALDSQLHIPLWSDCS